MRDISEKRFQKPKEIPLCIYSKYIPPRPLQFIPRPSLSICHLPYTPSHWWRIRHAGKISHSTNHSAGTILGATPWFTPRYVGGYIYMETRLDSVGKSLG
jgi:hypothetical protein